MGSFASEDLIQLPRLSASEAASLIAEMLLIAQGRGELPNAIERSRARLEVARTELAAALRKMAGGAATPSARRQAERAIDAAWEATYDWLSGWCKLSEEASPHRAKARALFALVFGEAVAYARLPYKIAGAESKERLAAIDRDGHEATFEALGGSAFLAELRRTLIAADVSAPGAADAHAELAIAAGALRQYVGRVMSHADPEVAGSEALSEELLRPLARFHLMNPWRAPEQDFGPVDVTRF